MSHTPGPWRALPDHGRIVLNGSAIYGVADITGDYANWNQDDLRLMAAAPELLDCCRKLLEIVEDEFANDKYPEELASWQRVMADSNHAIAKAEGRTDEQ